jgi:hypothetical protein
MTLARHWISEGLNFFSGLSIFFTSFGLMTDCFGAGAGTGASCKGKTTSNNANVRTSDFTMSKEFD